MAMRWLTREWQRGDLPDAERRSRWSAYLEHRDATAIHLPPGLHRLAATAHPQAISLHAAVPDWWVVDEDHGTITLQVVCGDPQAGYQRALLQYHGDATLVGASGSTVEAWLADGASEFLYDEIEILPHRRYEQRFLLGPDGEFAIQFNEVTVVSAPATAEVRAALLERRGRGALVDDEPPALATMPIAEPTEAEPDSGATGGALPAVSAPARPKRTVKEALFGWLPGVRRHTDEASS